MGNRFVLLALLSWGLLSACVTEPSARDYVGSQVKPRSGILVLPALNHTLNVDAPDYFLSTLSVPLGERGYYVFPAHMVKRTLEENGLADTGLIYTADTERLGDLFGCHAALYVEIERWDSRYILLATQTTVKFNYSLRSCATGDLLWTNTAAMSYSPQADSSSGSWFADLLTQAVVSAVEKAAPNYMPLARQANMQAMSSLPAGPYLQAHE